MFLACFALGPTPALSNGDDPVVFPFFNDYGIGVDELVDYVISTSPVFDSHRAGIESARLAHQVNERYFLPRLTLGLEGKYLAGDPSPDPDSTMEAILNLNSKLWGSQVATTAAASGKGLEYENLDFEKKRIDVYFDIVTILAKIERVRFYQYEAGLLRREKVDLVEQLMRSVDSGIAPVSELKEAELNLVRFDETILNATSMKENLFNQLYILTGLEILDQSEVGLSLGRISQLIEGEWLFSEEDLVENSLEIRLDKAGVEQTRLQAESENERIRLSLTSEVKSPVIDEPQLAAGRIRNTSFVGLRVDIQLFDFQARTSRQSSRAAARRQFFDLVDKQQRISAEVQRLETQYLSLQNQRENAFVQVRIGRELLESKKREIFLDRVTYLDLSKAVMLYLGGFQTLMNLDMQMYDLIFSYLRLKGQEI